MAQIPQYTRPASTNVTRSRVSPTRVAKDRSVLAMTAPAPANRSVNAENKQVAPVDLVLQATYSPSVAPTQLTGITNNSVVSWNITNNCPGRAPDFYPGDMYEFMSQDNVNGASTDALTAAKLYVLGVYVTGANPYDLVMILVNLSGGTASTPVSYIPTLLLNRYDNLSTDPNPIP